MSSVPPAKRRRIENASHVLSQPFKSPFKTPLKPRNNIQTDASFSPDQHETPVKCTHNEHSVYPTKSLPTSTPSCGDLPTLSTSVSSDISALQKRHTTLLNRLSRARSDLEVSAQALKIECSDRDLELQALIRRWRLASRAAAEEVFAKARDRVNRMGGVGVMKDQEKRGREGWGGVFTLKTYEGGEEDDGGIPPDKEEEFGLADKEENHSSEDEGEGYTMDMMLKALNIELDIIGYDKGAQKWMD